MSVGTRSRVPFVIKALFGIVLLVVAGGGFIAFTDGKYGCDDCKIIEAQIQNTHPYSVVFMVTSSRHGPDVRVNKQIHEQEFYDVVHVEKGDVVRIELAAFPYELTQDQTLVCTLLIDRAVVATDPKSYVKNQETVGPSFCRITVANL